MNKDYKNEDIILRAIKHKEIKWNVSKNIIYKDKKQLKELSDEEKKKDKYYFFNGLFPDEICAIIMKYKEYEELDYIKNLFEINKMKTNTIKDYILSKNSMEYINKYCYGRNKIIKSKMNYEELAEIFYYNIRDKAHYKSYQKVIDGDNEKIIKRNQRLKIKITELFDYNKKIEEKKKEKEIKDNKILNERFKFIDDIKYKDFAIISDFLEPQRKYTAFIIMKTSDSKQYVVQMINRETLNNPFNFKENIKHEGTLELCNYYDVSEAFLYKRQIIAKFKKYDFKIYKYDDLRISYLNHYCNNIPNDKVQFFKK